MARLVLVGLPGVGKSSLVAALARRWHCESVDTDDVLAARVGSSAASFLRENGERTFRDVELDVLREVLGRDVVVATGAGVVVRGDARALLAREHTLWLDCEDEVLLRRLDGGDRPLLGADHPAGLRTLRAEREPWYRDVAASRVDASGSRDDVLARIVDYWMSVTS